MIEAQLHLADIQGQADTRGIGLDEVGITGLRYPLVVLDRLGGRHETIATVTMSVNVPETDRGAHMSRFLEVLHARRDGLGTQTLTEMVDDLRTRTRTSAAAVHLAFPYFLERHAPVTGSPAFVDYECTLSVSLGEGHSDTVLQARVPVTSVCPCSKAVSDRGAHNQRGYVTVGVRPREGHSDLWFDDLIDTAEAVSSSPVYALLKRPDERHVTMAGFDNPVFVEDMARDVARALRRDPRVAEFRVRVVNDESIHNHAAYAQLPWTAVAAVPDQSEPRCG